MYTSNTASSAFQEEDENKLRYLIVRSHEPAQSLGPKGKLHLMLV